MPVGTPGTSRTRPSDHADAALNAQTAADARNAGARALATDNIDDSLLQAVAGARLDDAPATRANLQGAIDRRPQLLHSVPHRGAPINGLELNPDGTGLAVYDHQGEITLYDTTGWKSAAAFTPPATPNPREKVAPMAFSPDGATLAVGMPLLQPEPVRLLDATTLEPAGTRLPGLTTDVTRLRDRTLSLAWSADGSTLAALFHRIRLRRFSEEGFTAWDTTESRLVAWDMTGDPRLLLDEPVPGRGYQRIDRNQLALSPDGNTVWTSQPLSAIDVSTGQVRYRTDRVGYDLALSPDATTLALDDETDVLLLDPATGRLQQTLRGHTENVGSLEFNPEGTRLASTARDRTAIVWNPGTGEVLGPARSRRQHRARAGVHR